MDFNTHIINIIRNSVSKYSDPPKLLLELLRLLAKWRIELIRNTFLKLGGRLVLAGPFKGLHFVEKSAEGCHVPKLLGCYEQPLWSTIEGAVQTSYKSIVHIGCAEGYYAVGMARRLPNTRVFAFDMNEQALTVCKRLAKLNKVETLFEFGTKFQHEDFKNFEEEDVLIICDIEGGEGELLDPTKAPSLAKMDLIVETHDLFQKGLLEQLISRFETTHQIKKIDDNGQRYLPDLPAWFYRLPHLDQLLAVWEMRAGPTPWLVMKSNIKKSGSWN